MRGNTSYRYVGHVAPPYWKVNKSLEEQCVLFPSLFASFLVTKVKRVEVGLKSAPNSDNRTTLVYTVTNLRPTE